jgi:hypothetical protein
MCLVPSARAHRCEQNFQFQPSFSGLPKQEMPARTYHFLQVQATDHAACSMSELRLPHGIVTEPA